jgi:hypothetical protein
MRTIMPPQLDTRACIHKFAKSNRHVSFAPESGPERGRRLGAKNRREQLQQISTLFDHFVGAGEQRCRHGERERSRIA